MKRLIPILFLLGACAPRTATTTVTTTAVPTTSAVSASTAEAPTTPTTAIPITYETCDGDDANLFCEVYLLIGEVYVDEVDDDDLALAAATEVDALEENSTEAAGLCVIPNTNFIPVCEALADEGVTFAEAEATAVRGMLLALDPASIYFDAEALAVLNQDQAGEVEGIGALVASEDLTASDPTTESCSTLSATCRLVVVSTVSGGPAERAGIKSDDVFVAVDGESIEGKTIDEVTALVRGPAGTAVILTVDRAGQSLTFDLVREAIVVPVVETDVVEGTGYIRLNQFTDDADLAFRDALDGLLGQGIDRLILDLRDNPGGALFSTVRIASEFFDDGDVVRTVGPESDRSYGAEEGGLLADSSIPLVVLVNRGSASAAEVLSAALQERDLATVIGTNTFGKNTVQQEYGLSNGGAVKLTVARWVTDAGTDFGEFGVTPDVDADLDEELSVDQLVAEVDTLIDW